MGAMASQITSLTIVYSTVYSGADQRKHQSSASLAFVVTCEFLTQMASSTENVSIWWRRHVWKTRDTTIQANWFFTWSTVVYKGPFDQLVWQRILGYCEISRQHCNGGNYPHKRDYLIYNYQYWSDLIISSVLSRRNHTNHMNVT